MDDTEEFARNAVAPNGTSVLRDQVRRSRQLTITKGSTKVLSSKFVQAKNNDFTLRRHALQFTLSVSFSQTKVVFT